VLGRGISVVHLVHDLGSTARLSRGGWAALMGREDT